VAKSEPERCLDAEAGLLGHAPRRQVADLGSPHDDLDIQMGEGPAAAGCDGSRSYTLAA
jgi:hypothetical protein